MLPINKRLLLSILLVMGIALSFWLGSRYPQLNEKAMMGGETPVFGIGFDNWLPIPEDANLLEKVVYNTLNWAYTNKKGMFFGLLFASSIMLLFYQLARYFSNNRMSNTFLGLFIGAPLGVCVNCAAPIAQGVRSSGGRAETALAMLFSSPSLNMVVLAMLFSMFPFYMVALKLSFTFIVILVFIPLISRFFFKEDMIIAQPSGLEKKASTTFLPKGLDFEKNSSSNTWLDSLKWLFFNFFNALWYILKTTLPLMILAGLLGNIFITFLPFDELISLLPEYGWLRITMFTLILGLIGTFLPVPIAFDVIIAAILLAGGMPEQYVLVLLLSLGIYSVYAFFIVRQSISLKVAVTLFFSIAIGATVFAIGGGQYDHHVKEKKKKLTLEHLTKDPGTPLKILGSPPVKYPIPDQGFIAALTPEKAGFTTIFQSEEMQLELQQRKFEKVNTGKGFRFQRMEGMEWGINESPFINLGHFTDPMSFSNGIASGDVHNDGWPDIVLSSKEGIALYANNQGKGFLRQWIDTTIFSDQYVSTAALVDLNNDGWLDIYYSTFRKGNYVLYNQGGKFDISHKQVIDNIPGAVMTVANSFGDINKDGRLDILLGNMTIGQAYSGRYSLTTSRNAVAIQQKDHTGHYKVHPLSGKAGESWSVLITDFNDDGFADLLCGNDFSIPDNYYLGNGTETFRQLKIQDSVVNMSTRTTMSITTADINNDLHTDMYFAGGSNLYLDQKYRTDTGPELCNEIKDLKERERCLERMKIHEMLKWAKLKGDVFDCPPEYFEECLVHDLYTQYGRGSAQRKKELRNYIKEGWDIFSFFSSIEMDKDSIAYSKGSWAEEIPQKQGENILHIGSETGHFTEAAKPMGVYQAGWTWNCKFADLDNDEWQDLYAVNSSFQDFKRDDKFLFHNLQGQKFENLTEEANLGSFLAMGAYTYLDIDNDGDLDIIVVPAEAPVIVYRNDSKVRNAIAFEIRDAIGNSFGIGTKIIIHYGEDGKRHQMREIQSGGGFKSFDAAVAWFGLGDHDQISKVEVHWTTGETSIIDTTLEANATYRILRK